MNDLLFSVIWLPSPIQLTRGHLRDTTTTEAMIIDIASTAPGPIRCDQSRFGMIAFESLESKM